MTFPEIMELLRFLAGVAFAAAVLYGIAKFFQASQRWEL